MRNIVVHPLDSEYASRARDAEEVNRHSAGVLALIPGPGSLPDNQIKTRGFIQSAEIRRAEAGPRSWLAGTRTARRSHRTPRTQEPPTARKPGSKARPEGAGTSQGCRPKAGSPRQVGYPPPRQPR